MTRGSSPNLYLLADIGGTHARFAVHDVAGGKADFHKHPPTVLKSRDYPTLTAAIRAYLQELPDPRQPRSAVLAIAAPILGDEIIMTNGPWRFSLEEVRRVLEFDHLTLINDFTATALGVSDLENNDRRQIGGHPPPAEATIGVLGPGTGLGVSGLVFHPLAKDWIALSSEGGHVTLPASNAEESRVIAAVGEIFGHVSAERLLSGSGLTILYNAISTLAKVTPEALTPKDVTARAIASPSDGNCPHCRKALSMFAAFLGTVAADLALTLGARGGIYIAGGIVPDLGEHFDDQGFRARFEAKGRYTAYLREIPVFVVTHPYPAFLGLARQGGRLARMAASSRL